MPNPRLATRYAKALLDLAIEQGQLDKVFEDMQWLQAVCNQNREFTNLLRSPVVKPESKKKIVNAVTEGNIGTISKSFTTLLITKNRELNLPEICTAFINQYRQYKNINIVKLTSALPLTEAVKDKIIEHLKTDAGLENIELEETVKPDLIGGFVLEVGDKMIDASIAYDLRVLAKQFKNNDFIYKVR